MVEGVVQLNDSGREGRSSGDIDVPDSVEQTIISRIDRLERKFLLALKCASVAGVDFVDELLLALLPEVGVPAALVPGILAELVELGLLEPCAQGRYYTHSFKSGLVRAVIYERLPFTQRRELHGAVAQWIEGRYASEEELASFYPVLASHWQKASLDGEAIKYFEKCADLALRHSASHEAVGFLGEILRIVHACSPHERQLLGISVARHAQFAAQLADASLQIGLIGEATEAVELLLGLCQMPLPAGSPSRLRALLAVEMAWASLPLVLRARVPQSVRFAPAPRQLCELAARGYQTAARAFYLHGDVIAHDIVRPRTLRTHRMRSAVFARAPARLRADAARPTGPVLALRWCCAGWTWPRERAARSSADRWPPPRSRTGGWAGSRRLSRCGPRRSPCATRCPTRRRRTPTAGDRPRSTAA